MRNQCNYTKCHSNYRAEYHQISEKLVDFRYLRLYVIGDYFKHVDFSISSITVCSISSLNYCTL